MYHKWPSKKIKNVEKSLFLFIKDLLATQLLSKYYPYTIFLIWIFKEYTCSSNWMNHRISVHWSSGSGKHCRHGMKWSCLSWHTWYTCTQGHYRDSCDWIFESNSATKFCSKVLYKHGQHANHDDADTEAGPTSQVVWNTAQNEYM